MWCLQSHHTKRDILIKALKKIVGLQTNAPLVRGFHPYGGIGVAVKAAEAYGYEINDDLKHIFTDYRKTHNQGVFDVYNSEIRAARSAGIITGLPDAYGRGRIIGDYRRIALYGLDYLIAAKKKRTKEFNFPNDRKKDSFKRRNHRAN